MTVGLCLLVWNERPGCELDVPRLPLNEFDQVFAMDGGSKDGTVEYLQSAGIEVARQTGRGYNAAYTSAFQQTWCDALVVFPPKGNIEPETLSAMRTELERGTDLVVASRIIKGARNEEDGRALKPRKWFVQALGVIAAALWRREGYRVRDVLHGYRAMRRDAFWRIGPLPDGLSIDLEMVVGAYRHKMSRAEVAIQEWPRPAGSTHFKALPTGWKLLRYMRWEMRRRLETGSLEDKSKARAMRAS